MENKKDIQGHQGHSLTTTNGMDTFSMSLSKKTERLATALYLVTNFLLDNEPLKFRLRGLSINLVGYAVNVRYGGGMSERNVFEEIQGCISETLGLLELALVAGIISEMNFTILKREYVSLRDTIEVKKVSRESRTDNVLGDGFFRSSFSEHTQNKAIDRRTHDAPIADSRQRLATPSQKVFGAPIPIGHSKGHIERQMSDSMSFINKSQGQSMGTPKTVINTVSDRNSLDVAKETRRVRILKLIKDNREVTIKDIANHFPDVSEKTVQRELVSLTEAGVLKRFGERRWSRYALA